MLVVIFSDDGLGNGQQLGRLLLTYFGSSQIACYSINWYKSKTLLFPSLWRAPHKATADLSYRRAGASRYKYPPFQKALFPSLPVGPLLCRVDHFALFYRLTIVWSVEGESSECTSIFASIQSINHRSPLSEIQFLLFVCLVSPLSCVTTIRFTRCNVEQTNSKWKLFLFLSFFLSPRPRRRD